MQLPMQQETRRMAPLDAVITTLGQLGRGYPLLKGGAGNLASNKTEVAARSPADRDLGYSPTHATI
jgi:hypothetical protein